METVQALRRFPYLGAVEFAANPFSCGQKPQKTGVIKKSYLWDICGKTEVGETRCHITHWKNWRPLRESNPLLKRHFSAVFCVVQSTKSTLIVAVFVAIS